MKKCTECRKRKVFQTIQVWDGKKVIYEGELCKKCYEGLSE